LLAIACFSGRFVEVHALGDKDCGAHLVGHRLGIAAGDVLFAVAKYGGDHVFFHTIFAGTGGGGVAQIMESGLCVDLSGDQDALIFAEQVAG
jgi:hypothetical protein